MGPEEGLSLGEVVESRVGVVGVEVLDENRDEQARLAEAAVGESAEQFAHGILDCAPGGLDSLLAVLTPASMWMSRQSGPVREELAKCWKPVLVLYASRVLPGLNPSSLLAAAFLRPRERQEALLRIFRVPERQDDLEVAEDFRHLLRRGGGRGQFGYVLRNMPQPGDSLAFERHDRVRLFDRYQYSLISA